MRFFHDFGVGDAKRNANFFYFFCRKNGAPSVPRIEGVSGVVPLSVLRHVLHPVPRHLLRLPGLADQGNFCILARAVFMLLSGCPVGVV